MDRRAELEAAIDEDPSDPRGYEVLGDYLQQLGDPRGELIALQLAGQTRAAEQHLRAHPELAPLQGLSWRNGFVHRARLTSPAIASVLDHPSCRWIHGLELTQIFHMQDALDELALRRRMTLRELEVGTASRERDSFAEMIETAIFGPSQCTALARLTQLVIRHEDLVLERVDLPCLVELRLDAATRSLPNVSAVAAARWPALQRLDLRLDYVAGRAMVDALRALLTDTRVPLLAHFGLHGADVANQLLGDPSSELFAPHHALARLRSLDLSNSLLTDETAGSLAATPLSLERLDVSRNQLTVYGIRALSGIAQTVVADDQYDGDRDDDLYDY